MTVEFRPSDPDNYKGPKTFYDDWDMGTTVELYTRSLPPRINTQDLNPRRMGSRHNDPYIVAGEVSVYPTKIAFNELGKELPQPLTISNGSFQKGGLEANLVDENGIKHHGWIFPREESSI